MIVSKENIDKHEASFLDLNIKIKDGKFGLERMECLVILASLIKEFHFLFLLSECHTS